MAGSTIPGSATSRPGGNGVRQKFTTHVNSARCVCEATASSARALAHTISTLGTSAPRGDRHCTRNSKISKIFQNISNLRAKRANFRCHERCLRFLSFLFNVCQAPGALVPKVEMLWARARAEEAVASQTHRAPFTSVANFCLTQYFLWACLWQIPGILLPAREHCPEDRLISKKSKENCRFLWN